MHFFVHYSRYITHNNEAVKYIKKYDFKIFYKSIDKHFIKSVWFCSYDLAGFQITFIFIFLLALSFIILLIAWLTCIFMAF